MYPFSKQTQTLNCQRPSATTRTDVTPTDRHSSSGLTVNQLADSSSSKQPIASNSIRDRILDLTTQSSCELFEKHHAMAH
ncbi:MAG: hypothetical protein CL681_15485 [Blastopirellula sp.]|nr:hypothetical protein [Blastopirellula sp.]